MFLTGLQALALIRSKTSGIAKFSIGDKSPEAFEVILTVVLNIMVLVLLRHLVLSMSDQNQQFTHEVIN